MTGKELLRRLRRQFDCVEESQVGSHVKVRCGRCRTTVPIHVGEDLGRGLMGQIQRDLEPCLGERWLRRTG
jgi:predicted RNA binding protein YcfA (HicA-like mRNA interferase family)